MSLRPRKPRVSPTADPESDSAARTTKRRGFLLALGAGGIGAAAIAARSLTCAAPGAAGSAENEDATSGAGYRVTDHVKRYYRTAKV